MERERETQSGEGCTMEKWRRVGEKRGEGTINWLEPRSQGRAAGVGQGELHEKARTLGHSQRTVIMEEHIVIICQ